jgi:hypothetical protein
VPTLTSDPCAHTIECLRLTAVALGPAPAGATLGTTGGATAGTTATAAADAAAAPLRDAPLTGAWNWAGAGAYMASICWC